MSEMRLDCELDRQGLWETADFLGESPDDSGLRRALFVHREALDELEAILSFWPSEIPSGLDLFHPKQLSPTQLYISRRVIEEMIGIEDLPPVLLIAFRGKLFIADGHHRTTRALLDDELVLAVVFSI